MTVVVKKAKHGPQSIVFKTSQESVEINKFNLKTNKDIKKVRIQKSVCLCLRSNQMKTGI